MHINTTGNAGTRKKKNRKKSYNHGPLPSVGTCTRMLRLYTRIRRIYNGIIIVPWPNVHVINLKTT